ncbi:MAG TPA: hypothetical protein VM779_05545 [Thermoanaerobaculia bacterium]|nr:hypothetical protein [Thermoanaerobaculia bacterium]
MRQRLYGVTLGIALAAAASAAAGVIVTDRQSYELPLSAGGVLVIENPYGNIAVTAADEAKIFVTADRVIRAADNNALNEARRTVQRTVAGNENTRIIRTIQPRSFPPRWSAQVHYTVRMPRSAQLNIMSNQTEGIRVTGLAGAVMVKNVNGPVVIEDNRGTLVVQNLNGDTTLISPQGPAADMAVSSVNGSIVVHAPIDAKFGWDVETVAGEARTPLAVRGGHFVSPTRFRGSINAPSDVTVLTHTFLGNVTLLPMGPTAVRGPSIREMARSIVMPGPRVGPQLPLNANRRGVHLPLVQSSYRYETSIGDVRIDEVRGTATIVTGAGEIHLGSVFGHCDVTSHGGPLVLGDIKGILSARTDGGNITVERAGAGGTIETGGGTVQVQYAGGPVQLSSGGGDIVLRHAAARVSAETRSGDIAITMAPDLKSERVVARTAKGNVVLTLPAGFSATVEAVVVTSEPNRHSIRSGFPGLSIQREQVDGKTRIRATGKINGGGQRVELQAQDGGIQLVPATVRVSPALP